MAGHIFRRVKTPGYKGIGLKIYTIVMVIALIIPVFAGGTVSYATAEALLRASGDVPKAKTEKTIKTEKDLDKLVAKEKTLKEQISDATINRSKLLAAKRAELKQARQKRDDVILIEITSIKVKRTKQADLLKGLKKQLTAAKKNKNNIMISALEVSIAIAEIKYEDMNAELKKANAKLTQSYNDYKSVYDKLTRQDAELKKILDINTETEKRIKTQKQDYQTVKNEYNQSIKTKDFLTAEKRMDSLLFIQTGVITNYEYILDIKKKVKSDYYEQIVNYRI